MITSGNASLGEIYTAFEALLRCVDADPSGGAPDLLAAHNGNPEFVRGLLAKAAGPTSAANVIAALQEYGVKADGAAFAETFKAATRTIPPEEMVKVLSAAGAVAVGGAAILAAPEAIAALTACASNPVCQAEVGIAISEALAGEALGGTSLSMSVGAAGALVLRNGEKVVETIDLVKAAKGGEGFYNPRAWRQNYEDFYSGNVISTTVPPYSAPNVHLAGQRHPKTGIIFDQKGSPVFDDIASYDTRLSMEQFKAADYRGQMRMATRDLRLAIEKNPQLRPQFDPYQLREIRSGSAKIPGYTWHHHQDTGRMQLVDEAVHRRIWHVGSEYISKGRYI